MCGFAGCVDATLSRSEDNLREFGERMSEAVRHRGPDDGGSWVDASAGVALSHRRLSVIDLSPAGHQPMVSRSGRWVIVYNGEIYNYKSMRDELAGHGVKFRGASDTEAFLEYVDHHGIQAALRRADGMFALALWDTKQRMLVLARDRFGEKPLYYGWSGDALLFGSELKALRRHPDFGGAIDRSALTAYLRLAYVPGPHSIYEGIHKLPPGTYLEVRPHVSRDLPFPAPYWRFPESMPDNTLSHGERLDELERRLREAVSSRMVADVPVGAFLSGGIDSSLVVALMRQVTGSTVRTFSIGFEESEYDEAPYAAAVAKYLGTDHEQMYVTSEQALDVVPLLPQIYDEPFADSSQIPTFLVSEMTRRHVTVALSGDAGDELFGGYDRYRLHLAMWRLLGRVPAPLRRATGRSVLRLGAPSWDRIGRVVNAALPAHHRQSRFGDRAHKAAALLAATGPHETYRMQMSHWQTPTDLVLGAVEPESLLADPERWPTSISALAQVMYVDAHTYLPDDILTKVDRAAMAVGLETRVPMLAPSVIEFAATIPDRERIRGGRGKWLLRSLLSRYVPVELVDRPKMGFGVPIGSWLRGPLRPWAEDLLSPASLKREGHLNTAQIRHAWARHQSGSSDMKYQLWNVLMYLEWARAQSMSERV